MRVLASVSASRGGLRGGGPVSEVHHGQRGQREFGPGCGTDAGIEKLVVFRFGTPKLVSGRDTKNRDNQGSLVVPFR